MKQDRNNMGFSLIEVLVALIIISVGLLGIAAMQATGMQFNAVTEQRSVASLEITNFTSKMRANICGVQNTDPAKLSDIGAVYSTCSETADNASSYADYSSEATLPTTPVTYKAITKPNNMCTTKATPCDSKEQAQADLWEFSQNVASKLSGGEVRVTCNTRVGAGNDCSNSSTYKVSVFWQEANLKRDSSGQRTGKYTTKEFMMVFRP